MFDENFRGSAKQVSVADSPSEVLTVPELAKRLRVAPSWVYANADLWEHIALANTSAFLGGGYSIVWSNARPKQKLGSQPNDLGEKS